MEKAGRPLIGGEKRRGPAAPRIGVLQKQNSWSPDIERDEAWERRRRGMHPGVSALRRVRSVTDDDLDELRGCIDLGFSFEPAAGCAVCGAGRSRLVETLPALDLYYAVHGGGGGAEGSACSCGAASEVSSEESPLGSPMSILAPGESPETVKMRLKQWAQVVALSVLNRPELDQGSGEATPSRSLALIGTREKFEMKKKGIPRPSREQKEENNFC